MERRNIFFAVLAGFLAIVVGSILGISILRSIYVTSTPDVTLHMSSPPVRLPGTSIPTLAPVLKGALPGVVNIAASGKTSVQSNPLFNDPLFRRFFAPFFNTPDQPATRRTQSVGSGVIVDAQNGYVLTNQHLIAKADEIYVVLQDKRKLQAKVVGADPETDIALLQVEEGNLTALPLGNSEGLQVGDFVMAIGNPFGLGNTATFGIVSALGRTGLGIEGYENFIQTDASINPGNSGGALINLNGEIIGINTAILSGGEGNVGIGFAIPINMAHQVMDELIAHGKVNHGQIGVGIQDVTPELKSALGLNVDSGAIVTQVTKDSPATQAGIEQGDVIIRADNKDVTSAADVRVNLGLKAIGDKVPIELIHKGERKTVTVTIGPAPPTSEISEAKGVDLLQGATFSPIPNDNPQYGKLQGVFVVKVDPGSGAAFAGLQNGDIILSVNQQPVTNVDELTQAAKSRQAPLLLSVRRGNMALFIVVR
jgi:Do/DeqQ family serine protease